MGNENENENENEPPPKRRRRILPIAVLGAGAVLALFLASKSPHEQHVTFVLGSYAARVTALELQYTAPDGEVARAARFAYPSSDAPRVISHDPQLADAEYRLRIDIDTREGRRTVERRVTLGGGTTQVDLASPSNWTAP